MKHTKIKKTIAFITSIFTFMVFAIDSFPSQFLSSKVKAEGERIIEINSEEQKNSLLALDDEKSYPLGLASAFTFFLQNDLNIDTCDIEGRIAVGGGANLTENAPNYDVGKKIIQQNVNAAHVVVGRGPLKNFNTGFKNCVIGSGVLNESVESKFFANDSKVVVYRGDIIDFEEEFVLLRNKTLEYSRKISTGIIDENEYYASWTFIGESEKLNVFTLNEEMATKLKGYATSKVNVEFRFDVPENSAIIINIPGENVMMPKPNVMFKDAETSNWFQLGNDSNSERDLRLSSTILYNLHEATSFEITGGINGSILAPNADGFDNIGIGHVSGSVIAKSYTGSIEFGYSVFNPDIDEANIIKVIKKGSLNNEILEMAHLALYSEDNNNEIANWTTTKEYFNLPSLSPGNYYIKELKAPDGYYIAPDLHFSVDSQGKISSNSIFVDTQNNTIDIVDNITSINIRKTNLDGSLNLAGANLQIIEADESGKPSTDKTGKEVIIDTIETQDENTVIQGLKIGTYILREIDAPAGYLLTEDIVFKINEDGTVTSTASSDGSTIIMRDAHNEIFISKTAISGSEEIAGATLQVISVDANGEETIYKEWTTDGTGVTAIAAIPAGEYILRELTAPNGYIVAEEIAFTVNEDGTVTSTASSDGKTVVMKDDVTKLTISKKDITDGEELEGAVLTIKNELGETVATWTSTKTPKYIEKLPVGKYTLTEETAPEGYVKAETISFEIKATGEMQTVSMVDDVTKVRISKTDITGTKELEGARLQVIIPGTTETVYEEWTSTNTPHMIEKLPVGEYILRETTAPNGYLVAEDVKFTVTETSEIQTVEMKDAHNEIFISKTAISGSEEIAGATLQVISVDANGEETIYKEWTTDGTGVTAIAAIPAGEYILRELTAPNGYIVAEEIAFTVNSDGTVTSAASSDGKTVVMKDDVTKLTISKKDITDGEELEGAVLTIKNELGETVATWTSTKTPKYIEKLPVGKYTLTEETAPEGYVKAETISFEIKATGEMQTVEMVDNVTKVRISKTDITGTKELEGARLQVIIPGTTETVYEEWTSTNTPHMIEKLPVGEYILRETTAPAGYLVAEDVKFTVTETEEIQTVEMRDAHNEIFISKTAISGSEEIAGATLQVISVDTNGVETIYKEWTTDGTGVTVIAAIPAGEYILRELTAPNGYIVAEEIEFTVNVDGTLTSTASSDGKTVVMKDDVTKLTISKKDITDGEELEGAVLTIRDEKGETVATWTSTKTPKYIEKLPVGKYTLTEEIAPAGYVKAETISFEIKATGEMQTVTMVDDVTKVRISKTDITGTKELAGARLQVIIPGTQEIVYEEWTSTNTPHMIEKLPVGEYILRETTAPAGYLVAEDVKFTVTETGEIQTVEMRDEEEPVVTTTPVTTTSVTTTTGVTTDVEGIDSGSITSVQVNTSITDVTITTSSNLETDISLELQESVTTEQSTTSITTCETTSTTSVTTSNITTTTTNKQEIPTTPKTGDSGVEPVLLIMFASMVIVAASKSKKIKK